MKRERKKAQRVDIIGCNVLKPTKVCGTPPGPPPSVGPVLVLFPVSPSSPLWRTRGKEGGKMCELYKKDAMNGVRQKRSITPWDFVGGGCLCRVNIICLSRFPLQD